MSNFELIDDYLMNRLNEQEKLTFEQKLTSDNALKADVELQKHILEGVKKARVAELKAMLNNVPVGGSFSSGLTAGKLAATVVAAGVIAVSVYMYIKPSEGTTENKVSPIKTEQADSTVKNLTVVTPEEKPLEKKDEPVVVNSPKEKGTVAKKKEAVKQPAQQPALDVTNPSDELIDNSRKDQPVAQGQKSTVSTSSIVVETTTSNKKYNFHYQFANGKLMLFGSFDKSLYEILEIHGEQHTVFLYFKDNYYLLDEKQDTVTELTPIKDPALLRRLKEYRGR